MRLANRPMRVPTLPLTADSIVVLAIWLISPDLFQPWNPRVAIIQPPFLLFKLFTSCYHSVVLMLQA
ncbi:hypothetical protein DER45DRAFT_304999 [Fusarium avenaceum]|nr:hypothetical protein DER45DRAFT_304999 [Fusarium avenaceum]